MPRVYRWNVRLDTPEAPAGVGQVPFAERDLGAAERQPAAGKPPVDWNDVGRVIDILIGVRAKNAPQSPARQSGPGWSLHAVTAGIMISHTASSAPFIPAKE